MTPVFPVVGVGASAGGLEAFVQLLKGLDPQTGMAFVLVQHLDPTHESLLSEILARSTTMPVSEVTDGMVVEPNHVYVMPPNVRMTIASNVLKLTPRGTASGTDHRPIDAFFVSLASDRKEHAIGIVLSGTGSDGAKGVAAIAQEGGITLAQEKKSAKFDAMPDAAIAKGVDFITTPAAMAGELSKIARAHSGTSEQDKTEPFKSPQTDLRNILDLLHTVKGMNFTHYKVPTVQRRIQRRINLNRLSRSEEYLALLKANPSELDNLYEDILVKVTSFFRSPESFAALAQHVFPAILDHLPRLAPIRIWVPGCATGEEAYSIAICLLEFMDQTNRSAKIELFATDISEAALTKARVGWYDENIADDVSRTGVPSRTTGP